MIDRLAARPGSLYLLLAAYFTVNLLLRLAGPASLELDEGQQLYFAQWLAVGYDSQPPFYNWLQYWFVQLFGSSVRTKKKANMQAAKSTPTVWVRSRCAS